MASKCKHKSLQMQTFKTRNEWLAARGNTIGGSDAGSVLGLNKWRNNLSLWRIMVGYDEPEDISDRPFVKYGIDNEPNLRNMFKLHHPEWAVGYEENNLWTNTKYPFAHASLDGWIETEDGKYGILEIKTTEVNSKAQNDEWVGRVPDSYYAQALHYLLVTGFDFVIFCAELKVHKADGSNEWRVIERQIDRKDVLADIKELEQQERAFWWHVQDKTEPAMKLPM